MPIFSSQTEIHSELQNNRDYRDKTISGKQDEKDINNPGVA